MGLPKSTYYFELSKENIVEKRNETLSKEIQELFIKHKGRYGVRRIHKALVEKGYRVNHKRVQRIMHTLELQGRHLKKKYHSYQGKVGKVADNLIKGDFSTTAPFQKWTTDISQFSFSWGKCYFSPILDMATNEIISYDLSLSPNLEQINRMLNNAFKKHSNLDGLVMHSDQGWQYQHRLYVESLKKHGLIQSMSRKGNCYDNSIMESFFGRMKIEMYYGFEKNYESFSTFKSAVDEYIHYYNNERIQSKTKWMSPVKYRMTSMGLA